MRMSTLLKPGTATADMIEQMMISSAFVDKGKLLKVRART